MYLMVIDVNMMLHKKIDDVLTKNKNWNRTNPHLRDCIKAVFLSKDNQPWSGCFIMRLRKDFKYVLFIKNGGCLYLSKRTDFDYGELF